MKKTISVMAIPAKENKVENPYNYILYSNLQQQGVNVNGYSLRRLLKKEYDLVHIHWPENFLWATSKAGAYKALFIFWLKVRFIKFAGKKLVWTVHNLKPHEGKYASVSEKAYRLLYRKADGFISLTKTGAKEIQKWSYTAGQRTTVVPHPHYKRYYTNATGRIEARQKLKLPPNKFVFLFIGQVRAYKNVVGLVKAFKELNDERAVLLIAGKVHEDLAGELKAAIGDEQRIFLHSAFIKDEDLQLYLNAADLVVTPFNKIFNSGSVFLNLSFARPTLVPATESLLELQTQVGPQWIKTFEGELTAAHLQTVREEMMSEKRGEEKPDLSPFDWQQIAAQTKAFYQSLLKGETQAATKPLVQLTTH